MKADATPTPIETKTGEILGTFLPGLGYWVTPQNSKAVEGVLAAGMAEYEDPSNAPFAPADLRTGEGQVEGFIEVKD